MTGLTAVGLQLYPADVGLSGVKINLLATGVNVPGATTNLGVDQPDPGAAILAWDDAASVQQVLQWDDAAGNPQFLEWDT